MTAVADTCSAVLGTTADDAWIGFQRAHRELARRLESALVERHNLSLSALEVLGHVAAQEDRMRRLSRLAEDTSLSISRVSRIVDALVRRGLVERQPCPADTRATNARITDAGLELVRAAQADHRHDVHAAFHERLTDEERAVLAEAFGKLLT